MKSKLALLLLLGAGATACGGAPVPHSRFADAKAAVRAAEEVDADAYPTAAAHLKFARDQIEKATAFVKEDDDYNAAAAQMLERAELDAEIAVERAKAEKKQKEASEANQKVRDLANEDSQALLEQ